MTLPARKLPVPALFLIGACAATVLVYWIGLRGPFLFDDGPNFSIIKEWLAGKASLDRVIFGNASWFNHRPLSMASFVVNVKVLGYTPFGFKLANLGLHLLCGALAYNLLSRLMGRDRTLAPHAKLAASLVVAVWLLHPLNVSTVLYAVQRMAQWATFFCLLGMWLYVWLRTRLENKDSTAGWIALFVAIPALTFVGVLGKQNAVILPALCLVLELAYFGMPGQWPRPVKLFFALLIAIPAILACIGLAVRPMALLAGYDEYPFTLGQRLLSEGRVMWDYIQMLLVPHPPSMGIYTDDYLPSSGWLSPPSTIVSIAALAAVSVTAWLARKVSPSIFAGWFLFLAGHVVEGTILPIELYYEHRNYLPAFGLFLSCAGILSIAVRRMSASGIRMGRVGGAIAIAVFAMLAIQTHGRARVWSDVFTLAESALDNHPDSTRAVVNYAGLALESGDPRRAFEVLNDTIENSRDPKLRGLARMFRVRVHCQLEGHASEDELTKAVESLPPFVDLTMVQIMGYTRHLIESKEGCTGITRARFADALAATVDKATHQPDTTWAKWTLRYRAAALYAADGHWERAMRQAELAWQPTAPVAASELLVDIYLQRGMLTDAQRTHDEAVARAGAVSQEEAKSMARMRGRIAKVAKGEQVTGPFVWDMDVQ